MTRASAILARLGPPPFYVVDHVFDGRLLPPAKRHVTK